MLVGLDNATVGCFVFTPLLLVIIPSKVFLKELIHADPLNHGFPHEAKVNDDSGVRHFGKAPWILRLMVFSRRVVDDPLGYLVLGFPDTNSWLQHHCWEESNAISLSSYLQVAACYPLCPSALTIASQFRCSCD